VVVLAGRHIPLNKVFLTAFLVFVFATVDSVAGSQEGQEALLALLAGEAPCSATLQHVLLDAYMLSEQHVRRLSEVINNSKGA
jgi:hypothetical protein